MPGVLDILVSIGNEQWFEFKTLHALQGVQISKQ